MSAFDFLNTKYFADKIATDKRKKGATSLYNRLRQIARGDKKTVLEDYEVSAFMSEYNQADKSLRAYVKQLTKSKS